MRLVQSFLLIMGFSLLLCNGACRKDHAPDTHLISVSTEVACLVDSTDSVSYTKQVKPILEQHCLPCHAYPGTGGITVDVYAEARNLAISGMLGHAVIQDSNYVIMPPPPAVPLDSCEFKVLNLWILQDCPN